jgi:hypothetical protein
MGQKMEKRVFFLGLLFALSFAANAQGQDPPDDRGKAFEPKKLQIPYAFYNEDFGWSAGYVYGLMGWPQRNATTLATLIGGTNDTLSVYLFARNIQTPFWERLFLDPDFSVGTFGTIESYSNGNPDFPDERAGSNDSHEDNFVDGDGDDYFFRLKLKYLLPIGHGRDDIIRAYGLDQGLLVTGATGGTSWNPLVSGRTYLEAKPFYRKQKINGDYVEVDSKTNGVEFSVFHDNADFPNNPTTGSALRLRVTRDWQWGDSSAPYTVFDGEYSRYFSLGASERFRQRTIALDVWTADTPTWDSSHREGGKDVFHRPPVFRGATLGGIWRMRAYPRSRFNDRAAVYYCAEYRLLPKWHPLSEIGWLQKHLELAWWQWVPFVEVGRVADEWALDELHSDMKWDVGLGVRAMAKGLVIRIDAAGCEEGFGIQMMVGQPFQF